MIPSPLVDIPQIISLSGGEFWMGQDDGRDEERPAHRVRVSPFGLAVTQVTNSQYDRFCEATRRSPAKFRRKKEFDNADQPVVAPSWFDAVAYCDWLTSVSGKRFRLPTEAEWEFAARGGLEGRLYPWGDEPVTNRPNYSTRWLTGPEVVGTSAPNGYGLFDMCENVHEWCSDWYDPAYYSVSPSDDPQGQQQGTRRASRGGSWRHHIKIARCAARSSIPPAFKYAFAELEEAGYHIGSAYTAVKDPARTKFLYRDLLWTGADMIGVGVASFSHAGGTHFQNEHEMGTYIASVQQGKLPIYRALTPSSEERMIREFVLQMKLGTVPTRYFRERFGVDIEQRFAAPLRDLRDHGFVTPDPESVRLSRDGLLQVDRLLHEFFLPQHKVTQ